MYGDKEEECEWSAITDTYIYAVQRNGDRGQDLTDSALVCGLPIFPEPGIRTPGPAPTTCGYLGPPARAQGHSSTDLLAKVSGVAGSKHKR